MTVQYSMVIDLTTCLGCQACSAACSVQNETPYWSGKFRTLVEDVTRGEFPNVSRTFFPHLCMQCADAPCVRVCPTGASYKTPEGVVKVDASKCMGCKACIEACPYGARYVFDHEDVKMARELYGRGNPNFVPHVDKCDFCHDRVKDGQEPACVATCPGEARIFGDLNDPHSRVSQLVSSGKAKPLGAEYGTKPHVFYIG